MSLKRTIVYAYIRATKRARDSLHINTIYPNQTNPQIYRAHYAHSIGYARNRLASSNISTYYICLEFYIKKRPQHLYAMTSQLIKQDLRKPTVPILLPLDL